MSKKSELLKKIGWNDDLIEHFMIDDSETWDDREGELKAETTETSSLSFVYSAGLKTNVTLVSD